MKGINELYEYTGITRKRLVLSINYDILLAVRKFLEKGRERHDRDDRKHIDDSGRSCRKAPSQEIHSTQIYQLRTTGGSQSRWTVSGEARGLRSLHHQKHQTGTRQKIKPPTWWQWTTDNLVAVSLPLMDCRPEEISLRQRYPISSISLAFKICQGLPRSDRGRVESVRVPMKRFYNPFNFKAIETKYDGYHFRSRLEARWATFFNALDIPYEYEKEGYDLEGTWYLPDFWMPTMDCFIEIKGEEPTEEEIKKARLLSLYKGKCIYIISGNIGMPSHKNAHSIHLEHPPYLALRWWDEETETYSHKEINMSLEIRVLLQKLDEIGVTIEVSKVSREKLIIKPNRCLYDLETITEEIETSIDQCHQLANLVPLLKQCEKELVDIFTITSDDQYFDFIGQDFGTDDLEWVDCLNCGLIDIRKICDSSHRCTGWNHKTLANDTPRLLAAYEAARQARF